jgi:large subunit ribosomal protein L3
MDSSPARTRRSGLIAVKVGMTQEWDHWGAHMPLTVLWVDDCQVVQVKRPETDGYLALQLGCGAKRPKQVSGTLRGHFSTADVPIKRKVAEFRVTPDALLPVGFSLLASHFVAGQYVDVSGTSIGKGFQGVMKRWGFAGQPASHGNSLAHRGAGSTGGCQVC